MIAAIAFIASLQMAHHGVMHHFPQWSPDGASLLFSSNRDGDNEIYLLTVATGATRKLTDNSADDDAARWVEKGRRILFMSSRRGQMEPFLMEADGSNQRPTTAPDTTQVSPDGSARLLEEGGAIVSQSRDGSKRVLSKGPFAEQPSFSPDGRSIVYEQRSEKAPDDIPRSNIVAANADGSGARIVSSGTDPSWSPDGQLLLFKILGNDDALWIATISPSGGSPRLLSRGVHPHWSPDGKRITYMGETADGTHVWIIDRDGGNKRCLTCPAR